MLSFVAVFLMDARSTTAAGPLLARGRRYSLVVCISKIGEVKASITATAEAQHTFCIPVKHGPQLDTWLFAAVEINAYGVPLNHQLDMVPIVQAPPPAIAVTARSSNVQKENGAHSASDDGLLHNVVFVLVLPAPVIEHNPVTPIPLLTTTKADPGGRTIQRRNIDFDRPILKIDPRKVYRGVASRASHVESGFSTVFLDGDPSVRIVPPFPPFELNRVAR